MAAMHASSPARAPTRTNVASCESAAMTFFFCGACAPGRAATFAVTSATSKPSAPALRSSSKMCALMVPGRSFACSSSRVSGAGINENTLGIAQAGSRKFPSGPGMSPAATARSQASQPTMRLRLRAAAACISAAALARSAARRAAIWKGGGRRVSDSPLLWKRRIEIVSHIRDNIAPCGCSPQQRSGARPSAAAPAKREAETLVQHCHRPNTTREEQHGGFRAHSHASVARGKRRCLPPDAQRTRLAVRFSAPHRNQNRRQRTVGRLNFATRSSLTSHTPCTPRLRPWLVAFSLMKRLSIGLVQGALFGRRVREAQETVLVVAVAVGRRGAGGERRGARRELRGPGRVIVHEREAPRRGAGSAERRGAACAGIYSFNCHRGHRRQGPVTRGEALRAIRENDGVVWAPAVVHAERRVVVQRRLLLLGKLAHDRAHALVLRLENGAVRQSVGARGDGSLGAPLRRWAGREEAAELPASGGGENPRWRGRGCGS